MKLILKNFASVIKSNIDSPIQTVGVDISREERWVVRIVIKLTKYRASYNAY